jgi:hypothetical protein
MSGSSVERLAALRVDPNISRRGKLAVCLTRQDTIQATKQLQGTIGVGGDGLA